MAYQGTEAAVANKRLNAIITIGGTVTGALTHALGTTRTKLRQIGDTIRDLERQQKSLQRTLSKPGDFAGPVYHLQKRYEEVTRQIEKARREQERMNSAVRGMDKAKAQIGGALGGLATVGAVAAVGVVPVVQAASFETAMLGVAKQVDGARDAGGKLTAVYYDMARQIQQLGREIPVPTNELAKMAEAGARMGVARDDLIGFVRTTAEMSTALQLPREELADDMGKIANLFKLPIPEIRKLGDAINYLDDNSVAKGGEIVDFLKRTGGVAGSVRVTGSQMAALGSTLLSLGERSETASTATNAFFQKLAAADRGTKKFRAALDELGLSADAIQKGMQIDAEGTILKVVDAVNKLPEEKRLGVLVDMVGLEHSDTIAKLAGNVGEYRKQIDLVNSQKVAGSMGREFAAQLASTNAQWEIAKNRVYEVGVNIGSVLLPAVNNMLDVFGGATSAVADFAREHPVLVKNIGLVAGTLLASFAAWKTVSLGIGLVSFAFNALKLAMATNPIGLLLVALATGAVLIWQNWEPIKAFFSDLWDGISTGASAAWEFVKDAFLNGTPLGPVVANWGPLTEFFTGLWDRIKELAPAAWQFIKDAFLNVGPVGLVIASWGPLKELFGGLWDRIKAGASDAWDGVKGAFLDALPLPVLSANWEAVKEFFSGVWAHVQTGASAAWEFVKDAFLNAGPLALVTASWSPLKGFFGGLFDDIKGTVRDAIDWILGKIKAVGDLWQSTKQLFSFGGSDSAPPPAPRGGGAPPGPPRTMEPWLRNKQPANSAAQPAPAPRTPPPVPAPAWAGPSAGPRITDNSRNEFHITQRPGQDGRALAREVVDEQERRRRARAGSWLFDPARGY